MKSWISQTLLWALEKTFADRWTAATAVQQRWRPTNQPPFSSLKALKGRLDLEALMLIVLVQISMTISYFKERRLYEKQCLCQTSTGNVWDIALIRTLEVSKHEGIRNHIEVMTAVLLSRSWEKKSSCRGGLVTNLRDFHEKAAARSKIWRDPWGQRVYLTHGRLDSKSWAGWEPNIFFLRAIPIPTLFKSHVTSSGDHLANNRWPERSMCHDTIPINVFWFLRSAATPKK